MTKTINNISDWVLQNYKITHHFRVLDTYNDPHENDINIRIFHLSNDATENGCDVAIVITSINDSALFPELLIWNDNIWRPRRSGSHILSDEISRKHLLSTHNIEFPIYAHLTLMAEF